MFALVGAIVMAHELAYAQIDVQIEEVGTDQVRLSWSGGTPPYTVYEGYNANLSGPSKTHIVQQGAGNELVLPLPASSELIRYVVVDASAPGLSGVSCSVGSVTTETRTDVTGNLSELGLSAFIAGSQATVTGTQFVKQSIPIALGTNRIGAAAIRSDGYAAVSGATVERRMANQPPAITILDWNHHDPTPIIEVVVDDDSGIASFKARLNGVDVTSSFVPRPETSSFIWEVAPPSPFPPGSAVLQVMARDDRGYTSTKSMNWVSLGPRLTRVLDSPAVPGSVVRLSGSNFSDDISRDEVRFGGIPATVVSSTPTLMSVIVPDGATDGPVSVKIDGRESNSVQFDVAFDTSSGGGRHIAVDHDGAVYVSELYSIERILPDGTREALQIDLGGDEITGLAMNRARTVLYISSRGLDTAPEFVPCLDEVRTLETGRIRWLGIYGGSGLLYELPVSGRFTDLSGIGLDEDSIYAGAYDRQTETFAVIRIPLDGDPVTVAQNYGCSDVIFQDVKPDSLGNVYAVFCPFSFCSLFKNGHLQFSSSGEDLGQISVDCRDEVFVPELEGVRLWEVSPTGSAKIATWPPDGAFGVDVDGQGNIYVSSAWEVRRGDTLNEYVKFQDTACEDDFRFGPPTLGSLVIGQDSETGEIAVEEDPDGGNLFVEEEAETGAPVQDHLASVTFLPSTASTWSPLQIPAGTRVRWSCIDVDDPAVSTVIDPGGSAGGDNLGAFEPDKKRFEQEGSFTLFPIFDGPCDGTVLAETLIIGTESKVRFHFSDAPGDNFVIRAEVSFPGPTGTIITRVADSTVATVWRHVKVELDSMGEMTTGVEDDDAMVDDVPDPIGDILAPVLQSAYIEVAPGETGSRTNVAYDPHVPNSFTGTDSVTDPLEVAAQGILGRDNASTKGGWWFYMQGGYEGFANRTNDPDSEIVQPWLGITNGQCGNSSLIFAEAIRDYAQMKAEDEMYLREVIVGHEFGHQFGIVKETGGGIMDLSTDFAYPFFAEEELQIIRSAGAVCGIPSSR